MPKALTSDHSTRAGVWGLLTVTAGRVRYRIPAADEVLDIDAGLDADAITATALAALMASGEKVAEAGTSR